MVRYLAVVWHDPCAHPSDWSRGFLKQVEESLPHLRQCASVRGLSIFSASPISSESLEPHLREQLDAPEQTFALGTVFQRCGDSQSVPKCISTAGRPSIVQGGIDNFVETHWGAYVAFSHDPARNTTSVVRDPTGGVQCFRAQIPDATLFFSHVEDCVALGAVSLSLNWSYVQACLVKPKPRTRETGLNEVIEVFAGERVDVSANEVHRIRERFIWAPMRIAERDPIKDLEAAVFAAHRAVHQNIWAWAACHPRIVHRLSGGLDSAIVLACLLRAPSQPQIWCVNDHDQSVGGDEREFARLAARAMLQTTGNELIEYKCDPAEIDLESLLDVAPLAYPHDFKGMLFARQSAAHLARERDAALFDGSFGDQLFFRPRHFAAVDYAWHNGIDRRLPSIALSTACAGNQTVWRVLKKAIKIGLSPRRTIYRAKLQRPSPFVNQSVVDAFNAKARQYMIPPWLTMGARVPPGKLDHIDQLYTPSLAYGGLEQPGDAVKRMPLASQPLIELFLRIPTYLLTTGGQDRALARRAFSREIPPEIVRRRNKGVINHFDSLIFRRNREFIEDVLLNGVLVGEQLLNKTKIKEFLSTPDDVRDAYAFMFLMSPHLDLEFWLRSWSQPRHRHAKAAA